MNIALTMLFPIYLYYRILFITFCLVYFSYTAHGSGCCFFFINKKIVFTEKNCTEFMGAAGIESYSNEINIEKGMMKSFRSIAV